MAASDSDFAPVVERTMAKKLTRSVSPVAQILVRRAAALLLLLPLTAYAERGDKDKDKDKDKQGSGGGQQPPGSKDKKTGGDKK